MTAAPARPRVPSSADQLPAPPAYGARARIARLVLGRVLGRVPVRVRLADGTTYGAGTDPAAPEIKVDAPEAFFARVARSPQIGIGESYMAGEWRAAEGTDLAEALAPFAERLTDLVPPALYRLRHLVLPRGLNPANTKTGARENIEAHYDLSNAMFEQFLDPSLSYSCALFDGLEPAPGPGDLEPAQLRKVDAVLDAVGVSEGTRLLEIGTGWGTLAIRAGQRGAEVTSLTISEQQASLARERVAAAGLTDRVHVALRDYRDQDGRFGAVVSVEMVEAVGEEYWPTYFRAIDQLLAPGGKAAVQAILLPHDRMVATRSTYTWMQKYIFPGGLLPSVPAIQAVLREHTRLHLANIAPMGRHYAHTLRLWRRQFLDHWPQVGALGFGEDFRRMWEFYLAYCEAGFRAGYLDVAQLTFAR